MFKAVAFTISVFLISFYSYAQSPSIRPAGLNAYAGFGFSEFSIGSSGSSDFEMDRGVAGSIAGERGFGVLNSYLTFTINVMKSDGSSNYNYTPLSGTPVTATNISFKSDLFQFALGFKFKLFDESWFRPYVEGGAVGGYYQIKYSIASSDITSGSFSDAKTSESLFDSGTYLEAGFEIDFSEQFALKISARQMEMKTAAFETLNDSKVDYTAKIVLLSVMKGF